MPVSAFIRPLAGQLLVASLIACSATSQASEARVRWQQDIASGYTQLATDSANLAESAASYCAAPGNDSRQQLQDDWLTAFEAWQQVRFVDFGPIEQNSLAWQFQFWPDAKNLVATKVNYWLGQDRALNEDAVADAGVAVQGFPALEYLLWDQGFQQSSRALPAERSCALLTAISRHIAGNADTLLEQWQQMAPYYESTDSYTAATINAGMHAIEVIRDRRLGAPMGLRGNGRRNPYQADAWRSETSLATLRASLEGLQSMLLPGLALELQAAGAGDLEQRLTHQFAKTLANFDGLGNGMAPLLTGDGFGKLQSLYIDLELLEQLLVDDIAPTLGVARGFNSSDGD